MTIRISVARNLAILFLAGCQSGFGWGEEGHRLVVRIAERLLTPAAQAQVQAALAPGELLVDRASWADQIRGSQPWTASWHYVDIPLNSLGLDRKRDCPKGDCVIARIEKYRDVWRDPHATAVSRRQALLFLVHLVGDLRQPLHCEDNQDEGGNELPVRFFGESSSLHAVWDSGLLKHAGAEDALYDKLARALGADRLAAWPAGTVEAWAMESFRLAQGTVYGLLPVPAKGSKAELGLWYFGMTEPVVELQLEKAGVRLATILNESGL